MSKARDPLKSGLVAAPLIRTALPKIKISSSQERHYFLATLGLWRVFDQYFYGLQELA